MQKVAAANALSLAELPILAIDLRAISRKAERMFQV